MISDSLEEGVVSCAQRGELGRVGTSRFAEKPIHAAGCGDDSAAACLVRWVRERVEETGGNDGEITRLQLRVGLAHAKGDCPGEHEERLDGPAVQVERWARIPRRQISLEQREVAVAVVRAGLDEQRRPALDALTFAGAAEDGVGEGSAAVFRRLELVESPSVLLAAVAAGAEHVAEAHARGVDVEEDRGGAARVTERVDDVRRSGGKLSGPARQPLDFRPEAKFELTLEHVERVRVPPVHVRVRTLLAGLVAEPRERQQVDVGEDPDRPPRSVGDRLALAGP